MHVRLLASDEAGPEGDGLGPELERAREAGSVADPARGEHRERRHGFDQLGKQLPDRRFPPDVAARFHSLGDHRVHARSRRRLGLLHRPHLDQHPKPRSMRFLDERSRVAPEEHDRRGARRGGRVDLIEEEAAILLGVCVGVLRDDHVDPERPAREAARAHDLCPKSCGLHAARAEYPEAARVRDRRDELGASTSSETDGEDRVVDSELAAELRAQRRGHGA